ncbi:MAG: ADP-ribosylglycohydrolase family protein [Eubacteriales bacterium]
MLGAVYGDIIGSYYEVHCTKDPHFPMLPAGSGFTDDTVLLAAVCDAILYDYDEDDPPSGGFFADKRRAQVYAYRFRQYYSRYPDAGFGNLFRQFAENYGLHTVHSYGNGAAMRVIPIAYAYKTPEEVRRQARLSCRYTHRHKDAIRGAEAVASAAYLALHRYTKEDIRRYVEKNFGYRLSGTLADLRADYKFDSRASYSVPPAILAFLEASDYESAVRGAVSLGGDADTMACIAGGLAEAYGYAVPKPLADRCNRLLDFGLRQIFSTFTEKFPRNQDRTIKE